MVLFGPSFTFQGDGLTFNGRTFCRVEYTLHSLATNHNPFTVMLEQNGQKSIFFLPNQHFSRRLVVPSGENVIYFGQNVLVCK